MSQCEYFIIHDNVKLNTRSYTRRCHIAGESKVQNLSIPLANVSQSTLISKVRISESEDWRTKHLKTIRHTYSKSPQFNSLYPAISEQLLKLDDISSLSELNTKLTKWLANLLKISPEIRLSSELLTHHAGSTDDNHIALIKTLGGKTYLSGLGAKAYQDDLKYQTAAINLHYLESYDLLNNAFPEDDVGLSCIHLLMKYSIEDIRDRILSIHLPIG